MREFIRMSDRNGCPKPAWHYTGALTTSERYERVLSPTFALLVLLLAFPATAPCQGLQSETPKGAISGIVRDSGSSKPLAGVVVAIFAGSNPMQVSTDSRGAYKLAGLGPGSYRIVAYAPSEGGMGWGPSASKQVSIGATTSDITVDFSLRATAEIFGTVVDANKLPVPGVLVALVGQSYFQGSLIQTYNLVTGTDDGGRYRLRYVPPEVPYYLLVQVPRRTLSASSAVPVDPKQRKAIIAPAYYPGSPTIEGAQSIVLRPGEQRGIDITANRGPSYCIEGETRSAGVGGQLKFSIASGDVSMDAPGALSFSFGRPAATTGADGRFRVCELSSGTYRISTSDDTSGAYGATSVSIVDRDVSKVVVDASLRIRIAGEVVWADAASSTSNSGRVMIQLNPMDRAPLKGEDLLARVQVPGKFQYDAVLVGEYWLQMGGISKSTYLKDARYGSQSVLGLPLRAGSEIGDATLRVTLATDGGTVTVKATDNKGNPLPDTSICVLPSTYASDAQLATAAVIGRTDQNGIWKSEMLAPGKYYALATDQSLAELFPERVTALRNALTHATELDLSKGSSQMITVSLVALR